MPNYVPRFLALSILTVVFSGVAAACPICDSEVGNQVRAGIFDESFLMHLSLVVAPFIISFVIVGILHLYNSRES
jgi:hypothetical protein